jgi:hypothetical protein
MLQDSRARALLVSKALWPVFAPVVNQCPHLQHILADAADTTPGCVAIDDMVKANAPLKAHLSNKKNYITRGE